MVEALLVLRILGGIALLFANGFFVTTEFAMTRIRQFPEDEFQGHSGLERAWEMTERLEIYLSGCQVGITVASVGLGVVAEPAVTSVIDALLRALGLAVSIRPEGHATASVVLALALINLLHVVVGEQAPTYLGVERTKLVAKYCAPVLYVWTRAMAPFIRFADWTAKGLLGLFGVTITRSWTELEEEELSRADLRSQMGQILAEGPLPEERRQEILNAFEIGATPVHEIMIPREDVIALRTTDDIETNLEKIRSNPQHVRFPLVGERLDDIEGIVYTPTVLSNLDHLEAGDGELTDLAAPPVTVDADTTVSDVIDHFQEEHQELAFVIDGDEVVGLVTATDAFEAITGELEDPLDLGAS